MASSALTAFSQGTVVYNNLTALRTPIIIAPAFPATQLRGQPNVVVANSTPLGTTDYGAGAVGASGTGFSAELWAGADAASLSAVTGSLVPLRTGASFAGYITVISTLSVPQVGFNSSGTFQLRAWDNANGTINSWAAAMAGVLGRGSSSPFVNSTGGGGTPATLPSNLTGLTAFNLYIVPEPSLIALGALGLGALLLRRRKA